jgi:dihydrofolate reductase
MYEEEQVRKLMAFNHVTLDGYFVNAAGDFGWARHGNEDPEFSAFVAENAKSGGALVFGRKTYEMMASFWPTPIADKHDPVVAKQMNALPKVVFSRTLDNASWNNTRLVKGDLVTEARKLKDEEGPDLCILGSGSIIAQLAAAGVIDEYQIVIDPVALGAGRTMFAGIEEPLNLKLRQSRIFRNGKIFVSYAPVS